MRETEPGRPSARSEAVARAQKLDSQERHEDALAELRGASTCGDAFAATALAKRLLVGRNAPFSPHEAVGLLERAMRAGDPDAADQMATLAAAGAWMPQSWDRALELLQQAAEQGGTHAQSQLRLLAVESQRCTGAEVTGPLVSWKRLRELVNIETWVKPRLPRQILDGPRVWVVENFATHEVCDWLIDRARGKLRPALMFNTSTGISKFDAARTCSDFVFDIVESDLVLNLLRIRISLVTSLPVINMEPPQIFHYALGQEIRAHFDFLKGELEGYGRSGTYQGDRLATFLLYLNDDYQGGDLNFPRVKFGHKGKKGDAVFFASYRDGKRDTTSLHAAAPVTENEKWILSQWIHDRAFTA
jgi:hypothetical protein